MRVNEALTQILKEKKMSKAMLSRKLGYPHDTAVNNVLAKNNLTIDMLYTMCELLDYEITIQPKRTGGRRLDGQIVLDGEIKRKAGGTE